MSAVPQWALNAKVKRQKVQVIVEPSVKEDLKELYLELRKRYLIIARRNMLLQNALELAKQRARQDPEISFSSYEEEDDEELEYLNDQVNRGHWL